MTQQIKYWAIVSLVLLLNLSGCEKKSEEQSKSDETPAVSDAKPENQQQWAKHLGWHTQGLISRNTTIRIVFNHPIVDADQVDQPVKDVVTISPNIPGDIKFVSTTEIAITPNNLLDSSSEYKISLKPNQLKNIPQDLGSYSFTVKVIPLEYEINVQSLSMSSTEGFTKLSGQINFSDSVDYAVVTKTLKATLNNADLEVKWNYAYGANRVYSFYIDEIPQADTETSLQLSWDMTPVGISDKGSRDIPIPVKGKFFVMSVEATQPDQGAPSVKINFSQPLNVTQDLNGLVTLVGAEFTYRVAENILYLYPKQAITGEYIVKIHEGILSENASKIEASEYKVVFLEAKPQVRFIGNGVLLPDATALEVPFEAINVRSVKVTAFEIYPDNMGQFLQNNKLDGGEELGRVGRFLWQKTIPLNVEQTGVWNRYSFNVKELMQAHQGSLIRLTLSIDQNDAMYDCPAASESVADQKTATLKSQDDYTANDLSGWDGIESWYYENYDYNYSNRDNPCTSAYYIYYKDRAIASKNFIATNIGVLAKKDPQGNFLVTTTDLRTAESLSDVKLDIRNFQGQILQTVSTDSNGFAKFTLPDHTPFLLTATKGKDASYLKLNAKTALLTSHFDVGGVVTVEGIKGTIYGERGVWRPGDDIYLTFVLEDKNNQIPENHPVTMELLDPTGKVIASQVNQNPVNDFYAFQFRTDSAAQTGTWQARARIGAATFGLPLSIEMVRPNRLKIELDTNDATAIHAGSDSEISLFSQWLTGASAAGLKADVSVRFLEQPTHFGQYSDYVFDDPAREFQSQDMIVTEGTLDENGYLKFSFSATPESTPPGMLTALVTSRVFEQGGEFSISRQSFDYHYYDSYVGIKLPKGDETRNMLLTDMSHTVNIATVDADGKPVSLDEVEVTLYKINWEWWWEQSSDSLANFAESESNVELQRDIVKTKDGVGEWQFQVNYPDWGRYLVRACDKQGEHCTGKTFYVDWPGWAGRQQEEGSGAASRLNLFSDKKKYTVGETAQISLPEAMKGRALLTVESGSLILDAQWIEFDGQRKEISLPITEEMAPNVYVNVVLLQPHQDKNNDRPVRLYGIIPIEVTDPKTHLHPQIVTLENWQPSSSQTVKVSEKEGHKMTYTLAVVDEGLLGLTNFRTPDLHAVFNRREQLGITTWDIYDYVVGAYGGALERMIALGGDMAELDPDDAAKPKRFPPVVFYLGPFSLDAGQENTHQIDLPAYLGAVRVMVVAGDNTAYGSAEKSVTVTQPLMMLPSMPRILKTNEEVLIPVTIFALDDAIKSVNVTVKTNDLLDVVGDAAVDLSFDKMGEKIAYLKVKTKALTGDATLHFIAKSGEHQFATDINIEVRNSNPVVNKVTTKTLMPGEAVDLNLTPFGQVGSNQGHLEFSVVPPLNLEKHLDWLIRYPHGCLEQITSSAFPQLYLNHLVKLNEEDKKKVEQHINVAIERLYGFQKPNGDFMYWPGGGWWYSIENEWASLYAGHFLTEADKLGYFIPHSMLLKWTNYQKAEADRWSAGNFSATTQAYRLYILSLAGKSQMSAMNRLRESMNLPFKARWFLASAYRLAGQETAADALVKGLAPQDVEMPLDVEETFSTPLTNLGQQLLNLKVMNNTAAIDEIISKISAELNKDYQSTHSIAWALMAVAQYLSDQSSQISARYTVGTQAANEVADQMPFFSTALGVIDDKTPTALRLENISKQKLYATVTTSGIPPLGEEKAVANGLSLDVRYRDTKSDTAVTLGSDSKLAQGSDIEITVSVRNISDRKLTNIALAIPVVTGWEILSANYQKPAENGEANTTSATLAATMDFQDVRDDVVYNYFSLAPGESREFHVLINAAFRGHYYLPAVSAEAMYDATKQAIVPGYWLDVVSGAEAPTPAPAANTPVDTTMPQNNAPESTGNNAGTTPPASQPVTTGDAPAADTNPELVNEEGEGEVAE